MKPSEVLAERFEIGAELARESGAAVLLKGTPTVIFSPDGQRYVSAAGTAALATGGSGDVLTGMSGTLLAQMMGSGRSAAEAAAVAAFVHGRAAELCGPVRGTTLEDILLALPEAWNETIEPPRMAFSLVFPQCLDPESSGSDRPHPHTALHEGAEFDLVRRMLSRWDTGAEGIGDDAAVLSLAAGPCSRCKHGCVCREHSLPHGLASATRKLAIARPLRRLSDLAAMAAEPLGILVALTLPKKWSGRVEELADGIGEAARESSAKIVGGDLSGGQSAVARGYSFRQSCAAAPPLRCACRRSSVCHRNPGWSLAPRCRRSRVNERHRRRIEDDSRIPCRESGRRCGWQDMARRPPSIFPTVSVEISRNVAAASRVSISIHLDRLPDRGWCFIERRCPERRRVRAGGHLIGIL